MLGRLLVREHRGRLLAGAERVRDRLLGVLRIGSAREVVRELGQVALVPPPLRGLDRLPHPLVDPRPPRRRHALVQRLPDQRVREQVAPSLLVGLDQQLRAERLLQRRQELFLAEQHDPLEQRRIDIAADHRSDAQELGRRRLEPPEPERDHLLDPLGEPEPLELRRARAADLHPGLDQVADDLLDEERIALGLLVQGMGECTRGAHPGPHPDELGGLGLAEPPEVELGGEAVPAQLAERVRERVPALGRPVRADDQQARRVRGASEMAQQQQRRPVGPLEVVEHEQHRRRPRELDEQPHHRLEQPVALGLGLVLWRWRKIGGAPAQLGDQPRELRPVLARARPQVGERGVQGPVPEGLEERLVGNDGLARRAPREHDRARVVDAPRELGRERGLADPRVAGEQHDPATRRLGVVGSGTPA